MARTFIDACSECGEVFHARTMIGAQNQASKCYDSHFNQPVKDTKEALDEAWEAFGGRD